MAAAAGSGWLHLEVAYAAPERQALLRLRLPAGSTVQQAIDQSGVAALFPGGDMAQLQAGVWGRPVPRSQLLEDGDRVELYRQLQIDPREARRRLAAQGLSMGNTAETGGGGPGAA